MKLLRSENSQPAETGPDVLFVVDISVLVRVGTTVRDNPLRRVITNDRTVKRKRSS